MSSEQSYARLGLFIVVTLFVVLATATFFVQRIRSRPVLAMVTYTSENVSGLDVSSPVRLQGVPIGRVTDLRVDARAKKIEIDFEVFLDRLSNIGVDIKKLRNTANIGYLYPNLRAQVLSNPITGEAYLLLVASQNPPPPMALGFTPTKPYVPSMPSTTATVSATVQEKLPALLDRTEELLKTYQEVAARLPANLERSDRFLNDAERIIRESQLPALSSDSRKFFTTTTEQIEQMRTDIHGVMGREGELVKFSEDARAAINAADLPAATQSVREAADNSRLVREDLQRTLPTIRDSLKQLNELSRQLQEQPESVVYGPRPAAGKH